MKIFLSPFFAIFSIATISLLSGCAEPQTEQTEAAIRPVKIHLVHSPQEALLRKFPAQVHAAERAELAFRVSGELLQLPAQPGQDVKVGQLLARLDPANYQLAVDDRKARFQLAQAQFQRMKDLFDKGQVSKAQFDQVQAELDISKAALDAARKDLSYTRLKAPFSGEVAEVFVENHQPVAAGKAVIIVQARDQLDIRLQVPENMMANLAENDETRAYQPMVEFEALPDMQFLASYKEHNASADNATGSFTVTLSLARPANLNLLPGMSATVAVDVNQLMSQRNHSVFIPVKSVYQSAQQTEGTNQARVWVVNPDMTLSARDITIGQVNHNGIEVLSGLQSGEQILAAGVHEAKAGMRVRPWVQERGL